MKKVLIAVGLAAFVLFFGNGLLGGSEPAPSNERELSGLAQEKPADPAVAAPISRPFELPIVGGAEDVESGDIYGEAVDRPEAPDNPSATTDDEGEESATDELQRSADYRSAVEQTTSFAEAYGTHSYEQSAKEWVNTLPGLDSSAKKTLLASAEKSWPEMESRKASSKATPVAESVAPIYSRDGGGTVQLSVTVTKKTSYEGKAGFGSDSYAVTLERAAGADGGWSIVAVS